MKIVAYRVKILLIASLLFLIPVISESHEKAFEELKKIPLEELANVEIDSVYTASRFMQLLTEAPSHVTIVYGSDIKKYGYRNLADIIGAVTGFYVTYDRNYAYIGTRGFSPPGDYNTRVLLLLDGKRINDNIFYTAYIGNEFILDVDLIDRIEIVRGPGSSLYGSNAFFGVINVITRRGNQIRGTEVSGEAGSFDTYKGRVTYGEKIGNKIDIVLSASVYGSKGQNLYYREFDDASTNYGRAEHADGESYRSAFANIYTNGLNIQGAYISRKKVIPTAPWNTVFNTDETFSVDSLGFLDVQYEKEIIGQDLLLARMTYNRYVYQGSYLYDRPPITVNKDYSAGSYLNGEISYMRKVSEKHIITGGLEYQYNTSQKQKNYDEDPYHLYFYDKRKSKQWGVYVQDELKVGDNFLLNAGLRFDNYTHFKGSLSPRISLIYRLKDTAFKLIYGEAFRAPNFYELYYNDENVTTKANPHLSPEKIYTYQMVIEYFYRQYRFAISPYYYEIKNLISQDVDPCDGLLVFRNMEKVYGRGFELEIEGRPKAGIEGRIGYSYNISKSTSMGGQLINSPKHMIKFNLFAPIVRDRVSFGLETQYTGKRKLKNGSYAGGAVVLNGNLRIAGPKGLEISVSVYNLLDKKFSHPGSGEHAQGKLKQDGTRLRIKMDYKF